MVIIYFILGALLRLWYGSNLTSKFWGNRAIQTTVMIIILFSIYYFINTNNWIPALVISMWLQFQYFSRGHGAVIDTGDNKNVTEDTISRYNSRWYHYPVDYLFEKLNRADRKYGYLYDTLYLWLRYSFPLLPLSLILHPGYFLIGTSIPFIYIFANNLQKEEPWVFDKNKWYWRRGWALAEMLTGGVSYAGFYLLGYG